MNTKIPEHLVKNDDDSYMVFLNARLSQESRTLSFYHALQHIRDNDFEGGNVQDVGIKAHD